MACITGFLAFEDGPFAFIQDGEIGKSLYIPGIILQHNASREKRFQFSDYFSLKCGLELHGLSLLLTKNKEEVPDESDTSSLLLL